MKKIFLIVIIFLLLVFIGLAIFITTFDADRYRPLAVSKIEEAIGKPVQLERISLGWHGGIALQLRNLAIMTDRGSNQELLRVDSASALLEFSPLLHKDIQVSSLVLVHPSINLVKGPNGKILGLQPAAPPRPLQGENAPSVPPSAGAPANAAAALSFLISTIKIEDAVVSYRDESPAAPMQVQVDDIDIVLKNVSLTSPVRIQAKAALFSNRQNIDVKGNFRFSRDERVGYVEDVDAVLDLSEIDADALYRALPSLRQSGLGRDLKGDLHVKLDSLRLDEAGLRQMRANARLDRGRFTLSQFREPIDGVQLEAVATTNKYEIESLSANVAGSKIAASGSINTSTPRPLLAFQGAIQDLNLQDVMPPAKYENEPELKGIFSGSVQGTAQGISASLISQSVSGQGQVMVRDGVVVNLNILKEVFNRLSMIPTLVDRLQQRLPASYLEKLNERNTILRPVQIPFNISNGIVSSNQINIATDSFGITGAGSYALDGRMNTQLMLSIDPELSAAIIASIKEMQALADKEGRIQIPVSYQGPASQFKPVPDLQYIGSRLAVNKIADLFAKKNEPAADGTQTGTASGQQSGYPARTSYPYGGSAPTNETATAGTTAPSTKPPKAKDIFGQLLQSALENQLGGNQNSGTSSSPDSSSQQSQSSQ